MGEAQTDQFPDPPQLWLFQGTFAHYLAHVIEWAENVLGNIQRESRWIEVDGEYSHVEIPGERWLADDALREAKRAQVILNRPPDQAQLDRIAQVATILERTLQWWRTKPWAQNAQRPTRRESVGRECIRSALKDGCRDHNDVINWCNNYYGEDFDIQVDEAAELITFWSSDDRRPSRISWSSIPRYINRVRGK